jgi:glutamine synthetase type III
VLKLKKGIVSSSEISGVSETAVSEKVAERRTIVCKTLVDVSVVKIIAEKFKNRIFMKFGLLKPKPHEVQCVSIEKFYEPFLAVDARCVIDYHRKREISFEVDNDVQEVRIKKQVFKPELRDEENPVRKVTLPVSERITNEKKVYMIFDRFGNEIDPDKMPYAPSEENPGMVLEEYKEKVEKLEMPPDAELEIIRSRIVEETANAEKTAWQSFEVSDRVVMYIPFYEIVFENVRTGEAKAIRIDGVTGNMAARQQ